MHRLAEEHHRRAPSGVHPLAGVLRVRNARGFVLPAILLVLFPLLVLFNPPLAFGALAVAIVLLCRGRSNPGRRPTPQRIDDNAI
jgi:hypothetical protein